MTSSAIINVDYQVEIKEMEIHSHPAWYGDLSGVECEDLLRDLKPGSYLLRKGERDFQYYLSFVLGDFYSFKHQPFVILKNHSQVDWGYRNGGYHWASTLEGLIPLILHRPSAECIPIVKKVYGK